MIRTRWHVALGLLLGLLAFSLPSTPALETPGQPAAKLEEQFAPVMNRPEYKPAHWGLLIVEEESGKVVLEMNADKLFTPASVTKLYSVAAALDRLGPNYKFVTHVRHTGKVQGERLDGHLIFVASGDLTLGGRTDSKGGIAFKDRDHTYAGYLGNADLTEQNPLAGLNALAKQIADKGIRRVTGDVLIDDRLFEKTESTGSGPVQVSPVCINDNLIDFEFRPNRQGAPASVTVRPLPPDWNFTNHVMTGRSGETTRITITSPRPGTIEASGTIAADGKPHVRILEVPDAAAFARLHFIAALSRHGVKVENMPTDKPNGLPARSDVGGLPSLAKLESPPFSENAKLILKVSHNLHASTLPILMGLTLGERTLPEGLRAQGEHLRRIGVDVDTISFGGGAGGARGDLVTPRATVQLLQAMRKRPGFQAYYDGLPILGVDGTLATVVKADSPARGQVRAKTGTYSVANTMNNRAVLTSKALAGYMTTASGKKLVFCFFVNNTHLYPGVDGSREGRALGELCEIVHRNVK